MVRVALLLLACLRGNVILYQGEELGLPQADVPFEALQDPEALTNWPQTLGRDGARTPLPWTGAADGGFGSDEPWLPIDPKHLPMNIAAQERDPGSILNWTRRVIALRHQHDALRSGGIALADADPRLVAFVRTGVDEALLCLFNLGDTPIDAPIVAGREVVEQIGELAGSFIGARSAVVVKWS